MGQVDSRTVDLTRDWIHDQGPQNPPNQSADTQSCYHTPSITPVVNQTPIPPGTGTLTVTGGANSTGNPAQDISRSVVGRVAGVAFANPG